MTGALTFAEVHKQNVAGVDGLSRVSGISVSADGGHVYGTGWGFRRIAIFGRNTSTGQLTFLEAPTILIGGPRGITGSPDGANVYTTHTAYQDSLSVFDRDATTGALTLRETHRDGNFGVDGLDFPRCVTVSSDGANVYATGLDDDGLAVFSRDASTGALTFVEVQRDGVGGVNGLNGASWVTVSPDGAHVYATGWYDDAVAAFSRDVVTGALTFVEAQGGINSAAGVTVTPDGAEVYVIGDDTIAVFSRNPGTGALTFANDYQDGVDGVDGLEDPGEVRVSPDGANVYVASDEAKVAVFRRNCGNAAVDPWELCDPPGEQGGCSAGDVCTDVCLACVAAGCGNGVTEPGRASLAPNGIRCFPLEVVYHMW